MTGHEQPLISVVIPTYNNAKFLPDAIESVLSQTYHNIEIIVVNDGSTDNTWEVIKKYSKSVIYIEQNNAGPAKASNVGIGRAKGDYIAFLDADDMWLPEKLNIQIISFEKHPEVGVVYTKMANFDDKTGKVISEWPQRLHSGWIFDRLFFEWFIPHPSTLLKANLLREVGGFNEKLLTAYDTNLYFRLATKCQFLSINQVLLLRRIHPQNLSNRYDIPVGTLQNLDIISKDFPQFHPKNYRPMRQAYYIQGLELIRNAFYANSISLAHNTCLHVLRFNKSKLLIWLYWLITFLPQSKIVWIKKCFKYLRRKIAR